MLSKLEESGYAEVKERHRELISQFPLINAVISKVQKGLVYVDPVSHSSFISTKAGFSLFIYDESATGNGDFFKGLRHCRRWFCANVKTALVALNQDLSE
jgi:hypothetical protein